MPNRHDPYNQPGSIPPDERDKPIPWDPNTKAPKGLLVREISPDEWNEALLEHEARKLAKNVPSA